MTKKVGVIDGPNFLEFTGGSGENSGGLRMTPVVFTADRELIGRTFEIRTESDGRAEAVFANVEDLPKYVQSVEVKVSSSDTFGLRDLVVRPSLVVMDEHLAAALGIVIRDRQLQYARVMEVMRQ